MDSIPAELLAEIVESLYEKRPDYKLVKPSPLDEDPLLQNLRSVRLVCKGFKAAASKLFGETYFSRRCVLLEKKSLSTLVEIAENPEFRRYLKGIAISTYQFVPSLGDQSVFNKNILRERKREGLYLADPTVKSVFKRTRIHAAFHAYATYLQEQKDMRQSNTDSALLASALEHLSGHVDTVQITGFEIPRSICKIIREIGLSEYYSLKSYGMCKEVLSATIRAICWSRIELRSIGILNVGEGGLALDKLDYTRLTKCSSNLQSLKISLACGTVDFEDGQDVSELIECVQHLRNLTIDLPQCTCAMEYMSFPGLTELLGDVTMQHLESLVLSGFHVSAPDLTSFLAMHKATLRSLRLDDFQLRSGRWRKVFSWIHDNIHLTNFSFHRIIDKKEQMHLPQANLVAYVTGQEKTMDYKTMKEDIAPNQVVSFNGSPQFVLPGVPGGMTPEMAAAAQQALGAMLGANIHIGVFHQDDDDGHDGHDNDDDAWVDEDDPAFFNSDLDFPDAYAGDEDTEEDDGYNDSEDEPSDEEHSEDDSDDDVPEVEDVEVD